MAGVAARMPNLWDMRRAPGMALALACAATFVPSAQAGPPPERVELVIERVATAGAASFRLDLLVEPGDERGFVGGVAFKLDAKGRPSNTTPLLMTSLNERQEPAAQSGGVTVSTCAVGVCRTGRTVAGTMTVMADDEGPTDTPTIVVVAEGAKTSWTFDAVGYRLRRVVPDFRYITAAQSEAATGAGYLDDGAEVFTSSGALAGPATGSVAVAAAPCSTTGSGLVARGAGRITLTGGPKPVTQTCPIERGYLASGADRSTSWSLSGPVVGDVRGRMARLLVVDLPLRKNGAKTAK